jgi:nucleotide-binding universal stress UspA family protein
VIKDICVHLDGTAADAAKLAHAAAIAALFDSHVTGLFINLLPEVRLSRVEDADVTAMLAVRLREARAEGDAIARSLSTRVQALTALAEIRRHDLYEGQIWGTVATEARTSDLLIASRPYDADGPSRWPHLVEAAIFASGRSVLLVPGDVPPADQPGTVLVAWQDTREAARAVAEAMPLLVRARRVIVAMVEGSLASEAEQREPGADIARHLDRHGVRVELRHLPGWIDPAAALVNEILRAGANLAVIGAYGHSRLREWVLGGVTRSLLTHCPVPLLLAH